MKKYYGFLTLLLAVLTVSCVEKEPDYVTFPSKDVDFVFAVQGDEYTSDFYYVSPIQFTNTSSKTGTYMWDFNGDGIVDSNEKDPVYTFSEAGIYDVTLTIEGVGSRTYPLQVMDITPVLSIVEQSDEMLVVDEGTIQLGIELPNPQNKNCLFTWEFEEGTTLADGTPITSYVGNDPGVLKFKNIGTNKITLKTVFDTEGEARVLSPSYLNVQVASSIEAPTLYYASYGGNIKAYKMIPEGTLPEGINNKPYDMGVSSGVTPQCIVFAATDDGDYIYILDCGKNFTYQNDTDGVLGDGKITVMSADGTYANTMITNVGGHAFSDPFHGCVSLDGKNLLYTDRNNGVSSIALSTRGAVETRLQSSTSSYNFVNNASLGFYNRGITYGAVHSGIQVDNDGVYYWPKSYNATGVFRFRQSDIGNTSEAPCPVLLDGALPKAFAIDCTRKHMYVWHTSGAVGEGFCQYPLVGFDDELKIDQYTKFVAMDAALTAGSSVEALHVSEFAVDSETGNVYFGFNPDTTGETTRTVSGIYYYDYNAGTVSTKPLSGTEGEKAFGICINPRKTQLF